MAAIKKYEDEHYVPPPVLADPNNQWITATQKLFSNACTPLEEILDDLVNMSSGVSSPPAYKKDMTLLFTEDQVVQFIESRLGELAPMVLQYLDNDENEWIAELMLTPVFALLTCEVWRGASDSFPQTRLQLYSKFLGLVIRRAVEKGHVSLPHSEHDDVVAHFDVLSFQGKAKALFLELADLARVAHEKETPMFDQAFVKEAKCSDEAVKLGLLGGCKGEIGSQYSFHHVSIKDFLTAFLFGFRITELQPPPSPPPDYSKPFVFNLDVPLEPLPPEPHQEEFYKISKTLLKPRQEGLLLQFLGPQIPEELHCHYFYVLNTWLHCDWDQYGPERHGLVTTVECVREVLTGSKKVFPDNLWLLRDMIIRHTSALDLALIARGMKINKDIRRVDIRFDGEVELVEQPEKFVPVTRRGKRALKRMCDQMKERAQVDDLSIEGPTHDIIPVFDPEGFLSMCGAITTCPFRTVFLFHCGLGDDEMKNLAEVMKDNKTITKMSLSQNKIGAEGGRAMAEAMKTNTTLEGLYLYKNRLGDEGVCAMAEMFKVNSTLTTIYLNYNDVGDVGACAVGEALKTNKGLLQLYFFSNHIGPTGAAALAEGLKVNTTLQELFIDQNKILDAGAIAIGEALGVNTGLQKIYLNKNAIGDEGCFGLADGLKSNTTLKSIYIWSNAYGEEGAKRLKALEHIETVSA